MMAARRRAPARRGPSILGRVGSWLLGEVSGRHDREALARRQPKVASYKERSERDREDIKTRRERNRTEHERHMQQLRETREQRAAAILWHRQELLRAKAETERAKAERARTPATERAATARAKTAEAKADEYNDLLRQAQAGTLSPDKLTYFINAYGQTGKKRRT